MKGPDKEAFRDSVDLGAIVEKFGVKLKKRGRELFGICPFHEETTPSFTVTPAKNRYKCMGCDAGGDVFQFVMAMTGCTFPEAVAQVAGKDYRPATVERAAANKAQEEPDEWQPTEMPSNPPDAPEYLHTRHGKRPVVQAWPYYQASGQLIGYTCRVEFTKDDGTTGKEVLPITWKVSTKTGLSEWRQGAFPEPRPLYGLPGLIASAGSETAVMIVEGEKPAGAARRMFPNRAAVTWAGGCKAVKRSDWSAMAGRKAVAWPDADQKADKQTGVILPWHAQPGMLAMLDVAEQVEAHGGNIRIWCGMTPDLADGWDAADAEAAGITGAAMFDRLKVSLKTRAEILEIAAAESTAKPAKPAKAERKPAPEPESSPPTEQRSEPKPKREAKAKPGRPNVEPRALGYDKGKFYYFSTEQRQVYRFERHGAQGLLQLAPLDYWSNVFANGAEMKGEHWQTASDSLMRSCVKVGIFNPDVIRGRGCWSDEGRVIFNLGDRALTDGVPGPVDAVDSDHIYQAGRKLRGPGPVALSDDDANRMLQISKRFNWEMEGSAALLAGWIVLAPLCGALAWRSHLWLTGGTGTGKSTILNQYIWPLLAGTGVSAQGNSTEAGLRQKLQADALPVIMDEAETNDDKEEIRMQGILALMRQSSTESEMRTYKGTVSGESIEFLTRSMFLLSSINIALKVQADFTRTAVLGLYGNAQVSEDKQARHQEKWHETERMLADLRDDETFPQRLLARTCELWPAIAKNQKTFVKVCAAEFKSQRLGDTYGMLLAGTISLIHRGEVSEGAALKFVRTFKWDKFHEGANNDESVEALSCITQIMVDFQNANHRDTKTIGELIESAANKWGGGEVDRFIASKVLSRYGIRIDFKGLGAENTCVVIANKSNALRDNMSRDRFKTDWKAYLQRLPGARPTTVAVSFAPGLTSRGTVLPLDLVIGNVKTNEGEGSENG